MYYSGYKKPPVYRPNTSGNSLHLLLRHITQTYSTLWIAYADTSPPIYLHRGIEAFYPSIPHSLVLQAFRHYQPYRHLKYELLTSLLKFNFVTYGEHFYDMRSKGIPMGLPLAPELARMATAFLLRNYEQPLGHTLTIYFDDATYPILDLPLEPYILKETPANHTQDAMYNPEKKQFTPHTQAFRKCVPSIRTLTTPPKTC